MPPRKRLSVNPIFKGIDAKNPIANAANRKRYPWLQVVADDLAAAAGKSARAGFSAMRDKILDSPTLRPGSNWHKMINARRGNPPGARYETGTMFNSVFYNRGRIVEARDRRRRGSVTAGFGWPASEDNVIKDAPTSPLGRQPDGPGWRDDPKYFVMQEYGFPHEGYEVPGMYSQKAGAEAAKIALDQELKRRGYK